jgi:hypothetical protein
LKRFDDEDPAPEPKLAVPVSTITAIATKYNFTTHHAAVSDMVLVRFSTSFSLVNTLCLHIPAQTHYSPQKR